MRRRTARGSAYLVGAGPGDPGLITVRGREVLSRADLVIADALAEPDLLRLAPPEARVVRAGKRGGRRGIDQEAINRLMVSQARRGRVVVRLKGGDPSLFGRGGEEAEALARARVPFEIIPGVTAALGAAASTGIPLTHRRYASSVVLATGHLDRDKETGAIPWEALARADTLVVYMGMKRLPGTVADLLRAGRRPGTPAALVRWATRPDQRVVTGTLRTICEQARRAGIGPPGLLLVGGVIRLRRRLDWFGRRPLHGRTVVVTRAREQAGAFADLLNEAGARVLFAPAIRIVAPRSWKPLDGALRRIGTYRFVIFTSVNGVERFFQRLRDRRLDVRLLAGREIVAIGPATAAAIERRGLRVRAVPEEFRAEGLVRILGRRRLRGEGVLIPRAEVARDLLLRELTARGAVVDVVSVYRTLPSREGIGEVTAALRDGRLDLLTFTSSSTVTHFVRKLGPALRRRLRRVPVAAIGPITADTARRAGFKVAIMPRDYTIPALARAIERRLKSFPSGTPRGS